MLEIHQLAARHGTFRLGPVDLSLAGGEVLALCGPNGSGKTTLINVLLGTKSPESGHVSLDGRVLDLRTRDYLTDVGFVPDETSTLFDELTAAEHVSLLCARRDGNRRDVTSRAHEIMELLDFRPGRLLCRSYSHGMKKKLQLVLALMHEPSLLIVDELRNGLDPLSARLAEDLLIRSVTARGGVVVTATHDLAWVDRMQPRLLLLHRGRPLDVRSPAELTSPHESLEDAFLRVCA